MGDMEHIYGPVPSRRLGFSLGVDLVPHKICSFDCVYCQLGKTTEKTIVRREYVPAGDVVADVKEFLERGKRCDYITLSGSGEPTLNSKTGEIIEAVKSLTGIPVAVLTNGSTMTDSDVRRELSLADVVIPSLDAAVQSLFEKVNRPCRGMRVEDIIAGISEFKKSFSGKVWLEVMLVDGVNDSEEAFRELSRAIGKIKPDKVHLNTVVRPPCERWAKPLSTERLEEIANSLNAEVIADFSGRCGEEYAGDGEELIFNLLERRPCTLQDISSALGLHENEVVKYLQILEKDGRVKAELLGGKRYFRGS